MVSFICTLPVLNSCTAVVVLVVKEQVESLRPVIVPSSNRKSHAKSSDSSRKTSPMIHVHAITMHNNISHVLFELQLRNESLRVSYSSELNSASPEDISERPASTGECTT